MASKSGGLSGGRGTKVQDFESFAAQRGASRQDIGDPALHRSSSNVSAAARKRLLATENARSLNVVERRSQLRAEYDRLVTAGKVRPPTRIESLIDTARGHADRADTQAARRLLAKQGIRF